MIYTNLAGRLDYIVQSKPILSTTLTSKFMIGDIAWCIDFLIKTDRALEAALFAQT